MVAAGHPQRQAVAAALSNARRHPHAFGGRTFERPSASGSRDLHQPHDEKMERGSREDLGEQGDDSFVRDNWNDRYTSPPSLPRSTALAAGGAATRTALRLAAGGDVESGDPQPDDHAYSVDVTGMHDPSGFMRAHGIPVADQAKGHMAIKPGSFMENVRDTWNQRPWSSDRELWTSKADGGAAIRLAHIQAERPAAADGGDYGSRPPIMPYSSRADIRGELSPAGPIMSEVPGRTDHLPLSVAAGSYVIPADVVSGLGEGNTLAGTSVIDKMLYSNPYGIKSPPHGGRSTIPHPPAAHVPQDTVPHLAAGGVIPIAAPGHAPIGHARGGHAPAGHPKVPIIAAGGEYVVSAEHCARIGGGDIDRGHRILDEFVKESRRRHIKTLKKLPGPTK